MKKSDSVKKLLLPSILLVVTLIAYIIATVAFCYTTKPSISEGKFPFSITYEYKGEIGTISGVYKCKFSGSDTIQNEHRRYWSGEPTFDNKGKYNSPNVVYQDEKMTLAVFENMEAGYFMGDPLHSDYYKSYGHEGPYPDIEYYDYVKDISLNDENREELLKEIDFKIISCAYPEPIKNSFSFSGIRYKADNIVFFVVILLLFLFACLIFVRKDKEYVYSKLDKTGIIFNFIVGFIAIPFITVLCFFFGLVESGIEFIDQFTYNIPPLSIMCLALSVVFRRKGFSKTGFYIQFAGIIPFVLLLVFDGIFRMF